MLDANNWRNMASLSFSCFNRKVHVIKENIIHLTLKFTTFSWKQSRIKITVWPYSVKCMIYSQAWALVLFGLKSQLSDLLHRTTHHPPPTCSKLSKAGGLRVFTLSKTENLKFLRNSLSNVPMSKLLSN